MKNLGRAHRKAYLVLSEKGKYQLDEEFRKSIPGNKSRRQPSA
jgi:hypothetical protein